MVCMEYTYGHFAEQQNAHMLYFLFFHLMGCTLIKGLEGIIMDNVTKETFSLSENCFQNLVEHLVKVEENKMKLLDEYFPQLSQERQDMEEFIENYISTIDKLIKNTHKSNGNLNFIPFVVIGSKVEVRNIDTGQKHTFKIISPLQGKKPGHISFLSPMGKSLLLKRTGETVQVNAPAGLFYYQILAVYMEQP